MKTRLDIKHSGNLGDGDRTKMTFDTNSIAHLMSVLTDLYSDPELAVIREYASNAWDSHVAAGNSNPIQITLPTELSQTFVVKDFGTGMSVDQITQQFSKYGWSSKRDTDDAIGMLGLGCKSALAYTSQFTLVSVRDGVQATVLVTREADGAGAVQVIDTAGTDEPNGVEVRIPVSGYLNGFRSKAYTFFEFWEPGTVMLDGELLTELHGTRERDIVLEEGAVFLAPDFDSDYIVMGNVPYPVELNKRIYRSDNNLHAVIRVPIGTIDFTPSREALNYTKRTLDTIASARAWIKGAQLRVAQVEVDAAPGFTEALEVAQKWRGVVNLAMLEYSGHQIPTTFSVDNRTRAWNCYGHSRTNASKIHSVGVDSALGALHIIGHASGSVGEVMKAKLFRWATDNAIERPARCYFMPAPMDPLWLPNVRTVHVDVIKAIDLGIAHPVRVRRAKFRVLRNGGGMTEYSEMPTGVVAYVVAGDVNSDSMRGALANAAGDDAKVLSIVKTSVDKFNRDFPNVPHWDDYLPTLAAQIDAELTPFERARIGDKLGYTTERAADRMNDYNPSKVRDPQLASLIKSIKSARRPLVEQARSVRSICHKAFPIDKSVIDRITEQAKKYPLVFGSKGIQTYGINKAEVYDYLNALYLMREGLHLTRIY